MSNKRKISKDEVQAHCNVLGLTVDVEPFSICGSAGTTSDSSKWRFDFSVIYPTSIANNQVSDKVFFQYRYADKFCSANISADDFLAITPTVLTQMHDFINKMEVTYEDTQSALKALPNAIKNNMMILVSTPT